MKKENPHEKIKWCSVQSSWVVHKSVHSVYMEKRRKKKKNSD